MLPDRDVIDQRFAAYVRDRGEHHLRVAVLLTGDWHEAVRKINITFADFGFPATVSPPPASVTYIPPGG